MGDFGRGRAATAVDLSSDAPVELMELGADRGPDLEDVRELLGCAFGGELSEDDWVHALGGVHLVAMHAGALVGHVAVVERELSQGTRTWRTGYVEALGVHPSRRRRGTGSRLMARAEALITERYELGALAASEDGSPLYQRRGWLPWRGETWARTLDGVVRTEAEDDCVFILPVSATCPDRRGSIVCDWRQGDPW